MSLKRDFNIDNPRIAVLSLNPHAGENGILGNEERDVIMPALQQSLDEDGVQCFGPYAADGFFGARHYRRFDGVLAMYHDQGLAPFKTIAMDEGVNFTAGLPIVRTSPDHGTGYDIAMIAAIAIGVFHICLAMVIVQYLFGRYWFRNHPRGPLEGLWRKLTWMNIGSTSSDTIGR